MNKPSLLWLHFPQDVKKGGLNTFQINKVESRKIHVEILKILYTRMNHFWLLLLKRKRAISNYIYTYFY